MESDFTEITEYKGYRVGMLIIIKRDPKIWSSAANNNCPSKSIKYPHKIRIKKLLYREDDHHVAMSCEYYGWSLNYMIENDLLEKNIKEMRKEKIDKINKL